MTHLAMLSAEGLSGKLLDKQDWTQLRGFSTREERPSGEEFNKLTGF